MSAQETGVQELHFSLAGDGALDLVDDAKVGRSHAVLCSVR